MFAVLAIVASMFVGGILNRLRGTYGWMSKVIGVVAGLLLYAKYAGSIGYTYVSVDLLKYFEGSYVLSALVDNSMLLAVGIMVGYVVGESIGWGLGVGTLTGLREKGFALHGEREYGWYTGTQRLVEYLIPPTQDNWLWHCRLALFIRGLWWWVPVLAPLWFVGFGASTLLCGAILLAVGFPVACEIGYYSTMVFNFGYNYKTEKTELFYKGKLVKSSGVKFINMSGGWEHQEVWYGVIQDIVVVWLFLAAVL
jgi:hypothetical protein